MVIDMGIDILESFDKIFRTAGTSNPNAFLFEADEGAPNENESSSSPETQADEQASSSPETQSEEQAELTYPDAYKILRAAFGKEASLERREELAKCLKKDSQDASFQVDGYTINVNRTFKQKYQYDPQTKTITINLRSLMVPFISKNKSNPKYQVTNDNGENVNDFLSLFNDALNYALDKRLSKIFKEQQAGEQRDMSVPGKDEQPDKEEQPKDEQPKEEQPPKEEEPKPEGDPNKEEQPKQEEPKPEDNPKKEEQPNGDNDMEGPEEDHTDHEWFNIIASKFDNEYSHDMQNDVEPGMSDQDVQELGNVYYDDLMPEYDDKVSDEVKKKVYNYIIKRIRKEAGQNPAQQQQQQQGNNQNQNGGDDPDDFKWGTDDGDGDKEPVTEVQPMQKPDDNDNQPKKKSRSLKDRTSGLLGWLQHVGEEGGAANFSGGGVQATQPKQIDFDRESRSNEYRDRRALAAQRLANKKLEKQLAAMQKRQSKNNKQH